MKRLRLSVSAWMRISSRIETLPSWHTRLVYRSSAEVYSALLRLQQASFAEELKLANPLPPIFLLGFWRSGTTFLHELFCCDTQFGYPSTYACLNPSHFLLTEPWVNAHAANTEARRPMDNVSYSWASPQEDEFALLALGAPSPYQALLDPSLLRDPKALVLIEEKEGWDCWKESFSQFRRLLTVQQAKPLIFKSPPHGFRLSRLAKVCPSARYVLIERNPYEVFASNLKLWRTLINRYGLSSCSDAEIEAFVLDAYPLHEKAVAEGLAELAPFTFARLRYEDLVANPVEQMSRIYCELRLEGFAQMRTAMDNHLADVQNYTRNKHLLSLPQRTRIESAWGDIIKAKRYEWDDQYVSLC